MINKIVPVILISILIFVFYGVYNQASKSIKTKRLECQSKTTTFEKVFFDEPIKEAIETFKSSNYVINSSIQYSKYMKSNLIDIMTKEQSDEKLLNTINKNLNNFNQKRLEKKVLVDYYIYENDKEDSDKKNKDAKSYAGYLVFEFKFDNKLVYKIQTDYMDLDANDIKERMDCVVNSFISIN